MSGPQDVPDYESFAQAAALNPDVAIGASGVHPEDDIDVDLWPAPQEPCEYCGGTLADDFGPPVWVDDLRRTLHAQCVARWKADELASRIDAAEDAL